MLAGVQEKLAGFSDMRIVPLHYDQADTLAHLVSAGSVDGVVGAFLGDRWLERLLSRRVPMVNVGNMSDIHSIPSVGADFRATGAMAVRYFAEAGWSRTAIVHERASFASKTMHEGFIRESESRGIAPMQPRAEPCSRNRPVFGNGSRRCPSTPDASARLISSPAKPCRRLRRPDGKCRNRSGFWESGTRCSTPSSRPAR